MTVFTFLASACLLVYAALVYSGFSWYLNYTDLPAPNPYIDTDVMRAGTSAFMAGCLYRLPSTFVAS